MRTLDDAWNWYLNARDSLVLIGRLAEKHWSTLPWDDLSHPLSRDERFRLVEGTDLSRRARSVLEQLDDLAVMVLFSVFEAQVRDHVVSSMTPEVGRIRHPTILKAAREALDQVGEGSFFRVLEPFKPEGGHDVVEQVNQVRRYRNWVAHGRRNEKPVTVDPRTAYERLKEFLQFVLERSGE